MDDQDAREDFTRIPNLDDLVALCRHLNEQKAEYVVIGGFAVIHHGYLRMTGDIDLLVNDSEKNVELLKQGMTHLPDGAALDVQPGDLKQYIVVRVADEIMVDLMAKACGKRYEDLKHEIEYEEIDGIRIPFLSISGLIQTKQSFRPKDQQDKAFLEDRIKELKKSAKKTS